MLSRQVITKTKPTAGRKSTKSLKVSNLETLPAHRGSAVLGKDPNIPGFPEQKDAASGNGFVAGVILLQNKPDTARRSTGLLHREYRTQHARAAGGNDTRVGTLDIATMTIECSIPGPVFRFPNRIPAGRGKRNTRNENLDLPDILVEDKVSEPGWAKFP